MLEQGRKTKNKEEQRDRCSRLRRDDGSCWWSYRRAAKEEEHWS
jgi:hypothetical protein